MISRPWLPIVALVLPAITVALSLIAPLGYVPGWVVLILILSFYSWMVYIMFKHRETSGELAYGEVHV